MSDKKNATSTLLKPARISDIATLAGVGTATVDRVLNQRDNVRESTRQRVLQAKNAIEQGGAIKFRDHPWRLKIILPGDAGASTEYLAACLQTIGSSHHATIDCAFVRKMDPALLARKLSACAGQSVDAVAFQALDHQRVQDAVDALTNLNIPVLTLLSGLPNQNTIGSVAFDNRAAGRTAGHLMGRLSRQKGVLAIVTGGDLYQVHEDREIGFRAAIRQRFKHIEEIVTLVGHDNRTDNRELVKEAIQTHSDLIGIYNVGGGNQGIAEALRSANVEQEIIFIGHHLTRHSQDYLLDGTMDIVLHMDMKIAAEQTIESLVSHLENREYQRSPLRIEVVTSENMVGIKPNQ